MAVVVIEAYEEEVQQVIEAAKKVLTLPVVDKTEFSVWGKRVIITITCADRVEDATRKLIEAGLSKKVVKIERNYL